MKKMIDTGAARIALTGKDHHEETCAATSVG
jgi:predicted aspartyl protease